MKKIFSYFCDYRHLVLALAAASAAALAFAYVSQYGFNLQPCVLCLYQRKPYFAVIALGLLSAVYARKNDKAAFILLLLSGLAFVSGMAIAGFHIGVEQSWWPGLAACGDATLPQNATAEEMARYLASRPIVRCDVPAWTMFGISMTGYNFLLSAFLAAATFFFAFRGRRK